MSLWTSGWVYLLSSQLRPDWLRLLKTFLKHFFSNVFFSTGRYRWIRARQSLAIVNFFWCFTFQCVFLSCELYLPYIEDFRGNRLSGNVCVYIYMFVCIHIYVYVYMFYTWICLFICVYTFMTHSVILNLSKFVIYVCNLLDDLNAIHSPKICLLFWILGTCHWKSVTL